MLIVRKVRLQAWIKKIISRLTVQIEINGNLYASCRIPALLLSAHFISDWQQYGFIGVTTLWSFAVIVTSIPRSLPSLVLTVDEPMRTKTRHRPPNPSLSSRPSGHFMTRFFFTEIKPTSVQQFRRAFFYTARTLHVLKSFARKGIVLFSFFLLQAQGG